MPSILTNYKLLTSRNKFKFAHSLQKSRKIKIQKFLKETVTCFEGGLAFLKDTIPDMNHKYITMLATFYKSYLPLNFSLSKEFLKRLHKMCLTNSFPKKISKHLSVFFKAYVHTSLQSQNVFITKAELTVLS